MKAGVIVGFAVAGLFALMATAWAALFFFAGRAQVKSVPLAVPTAMSAAETTESR